MREMRKCDQKSNLGYLIILCLGGPHFHFSYCLFDLSQNVKKGVIPYAFATYVYITCVLTHCDILYYY